MNAKVKVKVKVKVEVPEILAKLPQKLSDFLADPNKWTQGAYAVTHLDRQVSPENPLAVKFCAAGAAIKLGGRGAGGVFAAYWLTFLPMTSPYSFNDSCTHSQVIDQLKKMGL